MESPERSQTADHAIHPPSSVEFAPLSHSASALPCSDAQANSRAKAERYRALADSSFDLICELDTEGCFAYVSSPFSVTVGLEVEVLQGTSFFDNVPDEDLGAVIAEYTAALVGMRVGRIEHRFGLGNGAYHWFESVLRGIGTGEERRVVVVSREITARRRHQIELETLISLAKNIHSKNELSAIASAVWEHLHPLLPVTALLLVLPGAGRGDALDVVGHRADGAFRQIITRATSPHCPLWETLEREEIWLDNARSGDAGFDFPIRSLLSVPLHVEDLKQGALFFAAAKPFVWTQEHAHLCLMAGEQAAVAVRGVRLLQGAREAETRYRGLVNDVDGIVWEADASTRRPTFVSQPIEQWLGYPASQWLADHRLWLRVVHPDDRRRVHAQLLANADSTEPWQCEFRAIAKDKRAFWLRVLVTPETRQIVERGENGESVTRTQLVRLRGLAVDITERARHLEAIVRSNAILAATQEASTDGICLVNAQGNAVSLNTRFAEMWHIPPALVEELRARRQLMACVLSLMCQPEEFVEKMNLLRQNPTSSSRDEIRLRDGRIFERTSAPARATPAALSPIARELSARANQKSEGEAAQVPCFGRVWTFSDITERKRYEEQLEHRAFHDPLTELPNRSLFMNRVEQGLARLDRRGKALAILFFDLDRFKVVNDTMGHEKGDALLQEIGKRLFETLRPGDTAARFGGDEFTLLLEDLNGIDDARAITERLIEALSAPIFLDGREFEITASIGVAMSFSRHDRASDLLRNADIAMYRAKNKGKARYEIFDVKMSAVALSRLQLEIELRQAVKWEQLRLDYQPLIDLNSNRIIGTEALVRWQHPDKGLISPTDFIPIAEESGMILSIGQWVLREACQQAKKWQNQFPSLWPLKMSVNMSARQFQSTDIVQIVADILEETELPAFCLELEITETAVMEDTDSTIVVLEKLRELGVKLAIDDFGTGYSSLAYIERFPIDSLKIDRSFVQTMGKVTRNGKAKKERSVIMQAVQTLGQGLGIEITAEGIETSEQLGELREMGCAIGQGYFFAQPLSAPQLTDLLRENTEIKKEQKLRVRAPVQNELHELASKK